MRMEEKWKPHRNDARVAVLMQTPASETVEEQRARCAEYGKLVAERSRDIGHDAYALAVERESEPHWWRDQGFLRAVPALSPQAEAVEGNQP